MIKVEAQDLRVGDILLTFGSPPQRYGVITRVEPAPEYVEWWVERFEEFVSPDFEYQSRWALEGYKKSSPSFELQVERPEEEEG